MTKTPDLMKQLHFNMTFRMVLDGSVDDMVQTLRAPNSSPDMAIEVAILRQIYEKILETKPLIQQLQDRGHQILHAKTN